MPQLTRITRDPTVMGGKPHRLWQHLLHNQHALLIKGALLFKPNIVVTSVPYHLGRSEPAVAEATSAPGRAVPASRS